MFCAAVFVYSMPGFKSSIKERMLYSSCKEPVVSVLEEELERSIDKKVFAQIIVCWMRNMPAHNDPV